MNWRVISGAVRPEFISFQIPCCTRNNLLSARRPCLTIPGISLIFRLSVSRLLPQVSLLLSREAFICSCARETRLDNTRGRTCHYFNTLLPSLHFLLINASSFLLTNHPTHLSPFSEASTGNSLASNSNTDGRPLVFLGRLRLVTRVPRIQGSPVSESCWGCTRHSGCHFRCSLPHHSRTPLTAQHKGPVFRLPLSPLSLLLGLRGLRPHPSPPRHATPTTTHFPPLGDL